MQESQLGQALQVPTRRKSQYTIIGKLIMMPNSPSGWGRFLTHVRTPLGGIVALVVLAFLALPIVTLGPFGTTFRSIYWAFFILLVSAAFIFIVRHTPKGSQGMVATEEFYALQSWLRFLRVYGDNTAPQTREEVIEGIGKMVAYRSALPPPAPPEPKTLDTGDDHA